ncbi:MAG: pyridoxal phosphate-dependent decarboxylase family protein [Nocardioidaceae bacterium]
MNETDWNGPLTEAFGRAATYLDGLPDREVAPRASLEDLRERLGGPLPDGPSEPTEVVGALADAVEDGLLATGSGRFFGFVFGGAMPAALAADWLSVAWDQNACLYAAAPAASVAEEVAAAWLIDVFGLPPGASTGFVTGAQMANVTGLAAARHEVLRRVGWDVERGGLSGAPRVTLLAGKSRHSTIDRAVRLLGFGLDNVALVPSDGQGRIETTELRDALARVDGPAIVCAQAGNVDTGAVDPLEEVCDLSHAVGAWVHVDGAFGLWAATSGDGQRRRLVAGLERADSWATDAHKWLNVPYDSGLVFCAHPAAHRAAMSVRAAYLIHGAADERDPMDLNPESSRRARGFAVYAALRALGRSGVAELVDRTCDLATRLVDRLADHERVEILNDVVLNQALVRFLSPTGDHDDLTRQVLAAVQRDGTCWMSGTTWQGRAAMRISVSNWSTTAADVDRSAASILRCLESAAGSRADI